MCPPSALKGAEGHSNFILRKLHETRYVLGRGIAMNVSMTAVRRQYAACRREIFGDPPRSESPTALEATPPPDASII